MSDFVVVDASVAFKWLVEEEHSDMATSLARFWDEEGTRLAAPHLMPFEVTNILHRRVVRGELTVAVASGLIRDLMSVGIELHGSTDLHPMALDLASWLRQGATYDMHYLALAGALNCELWTADERLARAARPVAIDVRWIGEFLKPE